MEEFIPQVLGLIALLGVITIVAVVIVAIIRPEQLPIILTLIKGIIFALLGRNVEVEVKSKRKNKDDYRR